jgi:glycosyltransferase involved in cell wall biosynthesis
MDTFVSIVIPIYNGYEFFDDCINSILEQTYNNWELLLGINGHGDDKNPIYFFLKEKVQKINDPRIRIFNFEDLKGAPSTINKLVSLAKYDWIAHIDIDDKWHPLKLEIQVTLIENECKDYSILGTGAYYFGETDLVVPIQYNELDLKLFSFHGNNLIHSSVIIKKSIAHYTDEFLCYDLDCWMRCLIAGHRIFNIEHALTYHRIHNNSFFNASGKQNPDIVIEKYVGNTAEYKYKLLFSSLNSK